MHVTKKKQERQVKESFRRAFVVSPPSLMFRNDNRTQVMDVSQENATKCQKNYFDEKIGYNRRVCITKL